MTSDAMFLYQRQAEDLCSLVDQCFQLLYTEATMQFWDRNLAEGARPLGIVRSPSADTSNTGWYCTLL